jgi:hypothetical protein
VSSPAARLVFLAVAHRFASSRLQLTQSRSLPVVPPSPAAQPPLTPPATSPSAAPRPRRLASPPLLPSVVLQSSAPEPRLAMPFIVRRAWNGPGTMLPPGLPYVPITQES